jgi:hypothetical protein
VTSMEDTPNIRASPLSRCKPFKRNCHGPLRLNINRVRSYSYMMRYSREHKAQNHEKILSVAARSFREHASGSSGIGTVMKKVGLKRRLLPAFQEQGQPVRRSGGAGTRRNGKSHGESCKVRA